MQFYTNFFCNKWHSIYVYTGWRIKERNELCITITVCILYGGKNSFCAFVVQCYLTGDSNVSSHEGTLAPPGEYDWTCASFGPLDFTTETANGSVQPFLHSLRHKVPILHNGHPYPPELPFPTGDLDLPCNTWCFGPMRAHDRNGTSIGSGVFAQMTAECPYRVCMFRPHNCSFPCWHLDPM